VGAGNFSLHHHIQNVSGSHPASYGMGTGGSFSEVKRPEHEDDHSPTSSAPKLKMRGAIPSLPTRLLVEVLG